MSNARRVASLMLLAVLASGLGQLSRPTSGAGLPQASAPTASVMSTVLSKDGTPIAVECAGQGPTLLFVHGGVGDRTRWTPMFPALRHAFTTCAMDRRGRGASGDHAQYSLLKEAEDVAAVVDARRSPVVLFGYS